MMKRLGAMMLMIREGVGASQQQVARGMLSVPNLVVSKKVTFNYGGL